MKKPTRPVVVVLAALNVVVLLGQVWPEGAPPFAGAVNIAFLVLNLGFLGMSVGAAAPASAE